MNLKINLLSFFILSIMTGLPAQKAKKDLSLQWQTIHTLPASEDSKPHIGLAGPVTGIVNDHLIVGGGANFPENPPWEGGKKVYHDKLYVLSKNGKEKYIWNKNSQISLPDSIAYSANVSFGKSLICIGGENQTGPLKSVLKVDFQKDKLIIENLPDLPLPVTAAGAVCINNKIYLAGGNTGKESSKFFFALNLEQKDIGWKSLSPLPYALEYAATVVGNDGKNDCIYLIGGRYKSAGEVTTTFSDKILKYNPINDQWSIIEFKLKNDKNIKLAAGTSVRVSNDEILLLGGDSGDTFNKIELFNHQIANSNGEDKEMLIKQKSELLSHHPGFNRSVYLFNTVTNYCTKVGEVPEMTQVTTSAFLWKKTIIIPTGEVKPGIRTPTINTLKILKK